jgi:pentatricopeptide repeat protein
LEACGDAGALGEGEKIHRGLFGRGMSEKDTVLGTALVGMYAKCGDLVRAQHIHDGLHPRDIVAWNALIVGYAHHGRGEEALEGLDRMQNEGFSPNVVTFIGIVDACGSMGAIGKGMQVHNEIVNKAMMMMGRKDTVLGTALVDMYVRCGELGRAEQVFDGLLVRDVPAWNAMIRGYAEQGHGEAALKRFSQMLEDRDQHLSPDVVTFLCVLTACCRSSLVHEGERCFESMSDVYGIAPQAEHYTCMVELFGRAGRFDQALGIVEKMPLAHRDYPLWLSLLTSCEAWGNVSVGRFAFDEAVRIDRSNGSAYACMIRLYVNACMYDEARLMIQIMESSKPIKLPPCPDKKSKKDHAL